MIHINIDSITNSIIHNSLDYNSEVESNYVEKNSNNNCLHFNDKATMSIPFNYSGRIFLRAKVLFYSSSYLSMTIGDEGYLFGASDGKIGTRGDIKYATNFKYSIVYVKSSSINRIYLYNESAHTCESVDITKSATLSGSKLNISGNNIDLYDLFVDETKDYSDSDVKEVLNSRLRSSKSNNVSTISSGNIIIGNNNSTNIDVNFLDENNELIVPYISLFDVNSSGKIEINIASDTVQIPIQRDVVTATNDIETSIKDYLSKSKNIFYYLCNVNGTNKVIPSCLEYNNENTICYVSDYIVDSESYIRLPYDDYENYSVKIAGDEVEPKRKITVNIAELSKEVEIIRTGDTNPVKFTIYKENFIEDKYDLTYSNLTSCGLSDYILAEGSLANNTIYELVNKLNLTHSSGTFTNIAPRIFKVPVDITNIISGEIVGDKDILIRNITGLMTNNINTYLCKE